MKSQQRNAFPLRVDPALRESLAMRAKENFRSLNAEIARRLADSLKQETKELQHE